MTQQAGNGDGRGKLIAAGVGGLVLWNSLRPETKDSIVRFLDRLLEPRPAPPPAVPKAMPPPAPAPLSLLSGISFPAPTPAVKDSGPLADLMRALDGAKPASAPPNRIVPFIPPDARWRSILSLPSVVIVLGKRGSGKSALAYRLLELFRYQAAAYVVGVPSHARRLLPDWIGIAESLEDIPHKSIAVVDEAYVRFHARGSMGSQSKAMSQIVNLSRQREQTLIFVTQEARQVDRNIASSASVVLLKEPSALQLEFERPELRRLVEQAKEQYGIVRGDKRRWTYVHAPDADFAGMLESELPTFWKPSLSTLFAGGEGTASPRQAKRPSSGERAARAKDLRGQGWSLGQIAKELGISKATVVNYLRDYPYQR